MTSRTISTPSSGSRADRVAFFIERFCKLSDGEFYGKPLELRAWQRELLEGIYAEDNGQLKHRVAYIGLPRKNGKSTLAAALAVHALVSGPHGAQVYSAAGDRTQARIVFREARDMVLASPDLRSRVTVFQHSLECPHNGGIYRALSADAKLQQGLNPSFVVFDEVHVQPNRHLWDALRLGMGTRPEGQMLGITTAGYDRDSLAWELYDHGRKIESGEIEDPTFYFRWWEPATHESDWRDQEVWREANPAFGDFLIEDHFASDAQATPESEFRRYRLNQWTVTQNAWLPYGSWDALERSGYIPPDGTEIILSFDGAWTGDSAALLGTTIEEIPHHFVVDSWERKLTDAEWEVPSTGVDKAVEDARLRWKVREMPCDPHEWNHMIQAWAARRIPVLKWETSSPTRMSPACANFYKAVMEKRMTHDGDPRLARHIANTVLKEDRFGARIVKRTPNSREHIDLAVTAVIGYDRATFYASQPARQPRRMVSY